MKTALLEYAMKKPERAVGGLKIPRHGAAQGRDHIVHVRLGRAVGHRHDPRPVRRRGARRASLLPAADEYAVASRRRCGLPLGLYSNKDDIDALAAGLAKAKGVVVMIKTEPLADQEMVKQALGDEYDELAMPPNAEVPKRRTTHCGPRS